MFDPTEEQQEILDELGNLVVIAQPGSGKTTTLALKINQIVNQLLPYQGVVAISYTNKASDELKSRVRAYGSDMKASFFGTIDKFYISEVVLSFGRHIFGIPSQDITVKKAEPGETKDIVDSLVVNGYAGLETSDIDWIGEQFRTGTVYLELVGLLAIYIFKNSPGCRNYIRARYTHIIIDEYQDSGSEQHDMFLELQRQGLTAIAVGDVNQSIYAFSKKDARYLISLTQEDTFSVRFLTVNHRCHTSIQNYAARLLDATYRPKQTTDIRVNEITLEGSEIDIARWIDSDLDSFMNTYQIDKKNKVGILVRSNRTGNLVHQNLRTTHKYFVPTPLDDDSSVWGGIFRKCLEVIFDREQTKLDLVEQFLDIDVQSRIASKVMELLDDLSLVAGKNPDRLLHELDRFCEVAGLLAPRAQNNSAVSILKHVLGNDDTMYSFRPAQDNQVQIMTLHKSKGLEFDLVFHFDLYRFILPMYRATPDEYIQDLNLHYVGITRAKKCCVLCSSTKRHRNQTTEVEAEPSEFFSKNGLAAFRNRLTI